MDMQDKDFDKLFSSKFDDFEAEPSPMVWQHIDGEINGKKGSRVWLTYLSIAATIAVVFTAGWLFLQKDTAEGNKHHNYAGLVRKDTSKSTQPQIASTVVKQPEPVIANKTTADQVASTRRQPKNVPVIVKAPAPVTDKIDDVKEPKQPVTADQHLMAQNPSPADAPRSPIMPDVQLSPKAGDVIAATPTEKVVNGTPADKEQPEPVKKHSIHNLGGLINVLIAKVDKRPHKIIEFSDDDDDDAETSLTGVNLGPLKIKKQ